MTRRRTTLATACVAVAAIGLSAQSAFAADVRIDTDAAGVRRVLFTEARTSAGDPADPAKTVNVAETNNVTVTTSGSFILVRDTGTPPNTSKPSYPGCTHTGDSSTVQCEATGVTRLDFVLGELNDTFDNQTAIPAQISGGMGTDTIINAGAGDDLISINGGLKPERDIVQDCGAGNDTVDADNKDDISSARNCETIKVGGVVQPQGGPPPPPPGGQNPPPPPANKPIVNPSPAGTAAPVPAAQLGVAPSTKPGACVVSFIGTAGADRFEGTPQGDKEFGLAGNDYMRGQAGDDCLYGLDGNDTLIGEEGLDLLVGGNGTDALYGGLGNDRLFGTAGRDRLYGNAGADRLSGGAGDDKLLGAAGNDQLFGGLGNDLLDGGLGNDVISGGLGRDHIIAGSGADRINVHDGQRDVVNCGLGRDSVTADRKDVLRSCERVTRRR